MGQKSNATQEAELAMDSLELRMDLVDCIADMDLPDHRKGEHTLNRANLLWLQKHIGDRNSNHPNYPEAVELIETILNGRHYLR